METAPNYHRSICERAKLLNHSVTGRLKILSMVSVLPHPQPLWCGNMIWRSGFSWKHSLPVFFSGLTSCPDICLMPCFVLFWPCLQLPFNGHIGALESFSLNTVYHFLYFCGLMSLPLAERWQWWNIQDLHVLWFWWIDLFWTDFKISARSRHCA